MSDFTHSSDLVKVDDRLGLVLGWAIICKVDDEDFYDSQNHHVPESLMLEAAAEFMQKSRVAGDMHITDAQGIKVADGDVTFLWPITTEIKEAFGLTINKTGLMIASHPSPEVFAKFKSGEYTGFSIGGHCTDWDSVEG